MKQFLQEHRDELKKLRPTGVYATEYTEPGARVIAQFLGWTPQRVGFSLQRMAMIDDGKLDQGAIESLPTERMVQAPLMNEH